MRHSQVSPQQILTTVMMRIIDKSTDHTKPHFDLLFTTDNINVKENVFSRARAEKGIA